MENDFLPLLGTDYIEFYVGNAKQAAHYYKTAFGFQGIAYAGPETGIKDRVSYVVRQNKLTFVFTSALRPDHEISQQVLKHGDAVKSIALLVDDADSAWKETTQRGAASFLEPKLIADSNGRNRNERNKTVWRYGSPFYCQKQIQRCLYARLYSLGIRVSACFHGIIICGSLCGKCWMESDEPLGGIL